MTGCASSPSKTGQPHRNSNFGRRALRPAVDGTLDRAVGFSNGANIASALLLRHPEVLAGAVLFAAVVPFAEPPDVDLTGKTVILANGRHDPMATADHTRRLVSQLRERGAEVTEVPHDGGHGIDPHGVARIAELLARPTA
jgi:phospholipase/carboxylesterase